MTVTETTTEGRAARDVLAWGRSTVDPVLRAAVDTLPASTRRIAAYHFGWEDEHGTPTDGAPGKALRPALVLLAAEAVGGSATAALPAAVAVELVHNFSLLHDDVIDGDRTRRHRPTAWTVFGVSAAILAGDALLTLAVDVLAESGHPAAPEAMRILTGAVQDLVDGQTADTDFERRSDVGVAECVEMARGKTGALLGASAALGALFGGGTAEQVDRLGTCGEQLGVAFQHADDLLGIWGDPAVTGKPVYSDLRSRKKSLPVVAALHSDTPAADALARIYQRDTPLSGTDLARAAKLVDVAGGRRWSQTQADDLLAGSLDHLQAAQPTPRAAAEITSLARLATRRDQ